MKSIFRSLSFGVLLWLALLGATSCASSSRITYFQDLHPGETEVPAVTDSEIRIRPGDKLSIIVNSRDPQLSQLFNLAYASRQIGQNTSSNLGSGSTGSASTQGVSGYTVDKNGDIDFPVLGKLHIAGQTREEVAAYIKGILFDGNWVKDPVVTVEYMNLCISVLGEVNGPGRYSIDRDQLTLLDALSMAGDLTIYGKRENVKVIRQENGKQQVYGLDLRSGEDLYHSPGFYLQQNDVVYVEPNNVRARQSTVNGNNVRSTSFWLSLASFLTTIGVLIFK